MTSTGIIATYPPGLFYEVAFNTGAASPAVPPWFADLSPRTDPGAQEIDRGRQYELDVNQTGVWRTALEDKDGALDPTNTASPYAPGVLPYRPARVRARVGANLLTADQSTAGDASGYLGAIPSYLNVSNDAGYTPSIVASGSAYQGSRVYQVTVPSGQGAGTSVLLVTSVPVVPAVAYSFSAQARIPSGTSTATGCAILWYSQTGVLISATTGASATPASGSSSWVALSASGSAPSTAYSAALKIQIASGSTAATTVWQADALQWERSATATGYQVPQTLPANLLPRDVATGTASLASGTGASSAFYAQAGSVAQATGLTAAPAGSTTALAWTSPPGTTSASALWAGAAPAGAASVTGPVADCVQVAGNTAYTLSVYLMRASSADATVQVPVSVAWFDINGNPLPTSTGTAATVAVGSWVRAGVTATSPATAAWGRPSLAITTPASTTAANTLYATGWQMEAAASASTWLDPGPTLHAYVGAAERWPQTWTMNGTYGITAPSSTDALAALAQYTLGQPFAQEVALLGPNFFYRLADASGSTTFADAAGKKLPAAVVAASPYGAGTGTVAAGSAVNSTTAAGSFLGTAGPVVTITNPSPGVLAPATGQGVAIDLHAGLVSGPPATGPWTRMIAFRTSVVSTGSGSSTIWWTTAGPGTSAAGIYVSTVAGGVMNLGIANPTDAFTVIATTGNVCDGNWHLVMFGLANDGLNFFAWVDGVAYTQPSLLSDDLHTPGIVRDMLGSTFPNWGQEATTNFQGDLAFAAEFPFLLTAAQVANLYGSFRSASAGESSGARAQRVLNWVGWTGAVSIDPGQTTNMGPATDLPGATALDALNAVALTENGNFYAAKNGAPTFAGRTRRYGQLNPVYIFGENAALGEWPYEDISADYDPQHLFNFIQVTQASTGQVYTAQDAASQAAYYPRILQRTINPGSFTEAADAANYLLGQYKTARLRISTLTLNPAAVPGLWEVCLRLEVGTRVRVMRRPPAAPTIQFDGFVESIAWTIDPVTGGVRVVLECSPADLSRYFLVGALHTTLNAQAASGQNQAKINALPDSAVNTLAQSLPQQYQLVFDPGTPQAETMTLAVGGIPATSPGYATATCTFTSNFAFTHQPGAVVCEPLPAGSADPTAWDSAASLGAASGALAATGAAGTNTISVGPLGDGKTNALGSDLAYGDLLWISPGSSVFEGYNLVHPTVATSGEGLPPLAPGATGTAWGVAGDLGVPTTAASGTAWQGAQVWQVAVAGGASTPSGLIYVLKLPCAPGLPFTASAAVRCATSGANPQVHAYIKFLDASANSLGEFDSSTVTLTGSPSATWSRLTATGTAPAATVWAQFGVVLDVAPAGAWSFQADGLQVEQASSVSVFNATPQVKSVAASAPGYGAVTVTLNTNLFYNHPPGGTVCDPLPPGTTNPASLSPGMRFAY